MQLEKATPNHSIADKTHGLPDMVCRLVTPALRRGLNHQRPATLKVELRASKVCLFYPTANLFKVAFNRSALAGDLAQLPHALCVKTLHLVSQTADIFTLTARLFASDARLLTSAPHLFTPKHRLAMKRCSASVKRRAVGIKRCTVDTKRRTVRPRRCTVSVKRRTIFNKNCAIFDKTPTVCARLSAPNRVKPVFTPENPGFPAVRCHFPRPFQSNNQNIPTHHYGHHKPR